MNARRPAGPGAGPRRARPAAGVPPAAPGREREPRTRRTSQAARRGCGRDGQRGDAVPPQRRARARRAPGLRPARRGGRGASARRAAPRPIARAVALASRASSTCSSAWPRSRASRFFNDSKATNVDAARQSLVAFAGPVLVILGGRYKGGDFAELADLVAERTARPCWRSARRASACASRAVGGGAGRSTARACDEAVERACARGEPGDTVLLAPGLLLVRHVPRLRRARPRLQGARWQAAGRARRDGDG